MAGQGVSVPLWASILEAADAWGTPPWKIAGGTKTLWFIRWRFFANERSEFLAEKYKKR
jgi:hypothetical protein